MNASYLGPITKDDNMEDQNSSPDPLCLSIVIVSYCTKELLERCLRSIYRNVRTQFEVIVIDNASTDGSGQMVQHDFPAVTLVSNKDNKGFAAANNQAFDVARGRYVVLLNPDTEVISDALDLAVAFLDQEPSAGLIGCQLLNPDGSLQVSCGASDYTLGYVFSRIVVRLLFLDRLMDTFFPEWVYPGQGWLTPKQHQVTREVKHVMGACMVVRHSVIDQVGGLDERYFMFIEETDWCYRIRKAGWRILYLPAAKITHVGRASVSKVEGFLDEDWIYHLYRGRLVFFQQNRGMAQARVYKVLLIFSVLTRMVPRIIAITLGLRPEKYRRQVRGLWRALTLVWQG